jgi:hypothetical protein
VENVSPRNRSTTGAEGSASASAVPDPGVATASIQRPSSESLELASDAAEEVEAFPWWHPAEPHGPPADDGSGMDEPEQIEEPSFEPLTAAPARAPQPRRPDALKPLPSAVLTVIPDAPPPGHPRRNLHSSLGAQSQLWRAVAEPASPGPAPRSGDDVLLLDVPVARRSRAVSAVLISIVVCGVGAIYAVGYLGLGADLKAILERDAVSQSTASAGASSRSASEGEDAAQTPPSVIVAIPRAPAAPDGATSPAAIAASSTPAGSKAPDPPPLPETLAPPRAVADSPPLPSAARPSGAPPARPLHSTRAPRPENYSPTARLEPASTLPRPEDPADVAGRSAPTASSPSAVPPAPPPAVLPVSETAPVRIARGGEVPVAAASPPRLAADETAPPVPPRPALALRETSPALVVAAPAALPTSELPAPRVEALAPPAAAPAVDRLPPTAAPDLRPTLAPALPAAPALSPDALPAAPDRASNVKAAAAEIDPAVLVRRGRELLAAGDIAAARRFFERAAEAGNAPAATGAGRTYDPLYLRQAARGLRGDPQKAADWYRKAVALGDGEAGVLLMRLLAARMP